MELAIILPTYNESENIESLILAIENLNIDLNILVIDDSSPDGTSEIVRRLQKRFSNVMLIVRQCKMGLGTAIRDGFKFLMSLHVKPKYIVTMDADFSHDPKDVPRLLEHAKEGYDVVVGSRYMKGGKIAGWGFSRRVTSKMANKMAKAAIRLPISDFTSGFRCYSIDYVQKALPNLRSKTFEIQIETLKRAKLLNMKVAEIPILFINRKKGKSKLSAREIRDFSIFIMKSLLSLKRKR
ncbi:polyprenol monophosphomannose synthase [Candidatus Bathyarchaeota archaeon]|nr:polyprenol monophosphomannose synthase [Candidatus Bathyarchaeota archaeon]